MNEKRFRQDQICDITDDTTGKPHSNAKQEIPMYVNEVGNSGSKENVLIRSADDSHTVEYYVRLMESTKPGQTVELLTNYGTPYEDVRERKGYGKKNLHQRDKSDDDLGARLHGVLIYVSRSKKCAKIGHCQISTAFWTMSLIRYGFP